MLRRDKQIGDESVAAVRQETFGELFGVLFGSVAEEAPFGGLGRAHAQVVRDL